MQNVPLCQVLLYDDYHQNEPLLEKSPCSVRQPFRRLLVTTLRSGSVSVRSWASTLKSGSRDFESDSWGLRLDDRSGGSDANFVEKKAAIALEVVAAVLDIGARAVAARMASLGGLGVYAIFDRRSIGMRTVPVKGCANVDATSTVSVECALDAKCPFAPL